MQIIVCGLIVLCFNTTLCMDIPETPQIPHSFNQESKLMAIELRSFLKDVIGLTIPNYPLTAPQLLDRYQPLTHYLFASKTNMQSVITAANIGSLEQLPELSPSLLSNVRSTPTSSASQSDIYALFTDQVDAAIAKIDFNTITNLATLTTQQDGINLSNYSPSIQTIIQDVLNKYLNNLPLIMKKRIIMAYLSQNPDASQEELIAAVLLEAGPIIQKLFQLIGQSSSSATLRKTMQRLQTQLKSVPLEVSKPIIQQALGADFSLFSQANFKNLGAASIAQAILVTTPDKEEFIVKVLKPGVIDTVHQEYDILMKKVLSTQAGKEKLTQIYNNIVDELDFSSEARYLQQGHAVYQYCQGAGVITTPHIPKGNFVHKHILVMSKAAGKPLSAFDAQEVQLTKLLALYQFYFLWLQEALFGSGFFHGDTHAGNIFLNIRNNSAHSFVLTPIDFGACAQLTKQQQSTIILLTLGLELQIPNFIALAIKRLATNNYDEKLLLEKLLTLVNGATPKTPAVSLDTITQYANNLISKDRSAWGMAEKTAAFLLAQNLLRTLSEIQKQQSEPTSYKRFMEILDELNIALPQSFTLFMRGQRFLEQQINTIIAEQKLSGEQFYSVLFKQLAQSQSPITAVPQFLSTYSTNMILNILMSGLQKSLKDSPCTIL